MKIRFLLVLAVTCAVAGCQMQRGGKAARQESTDSVCSDECTAKSKTGDLACKLTSAELQERKATVLASLREKVIEKRELRDGYAFKFPGSDEVLDELTEFIKTERECCDFFTFNLSISGDKGEAWLELTGAKGAKDFIATELGL
jgi:hypothetical protein